MNRGGGGILNACGVGHQVANRYGMIGLAEASRVRAHIGGNVLVSKLRQILFNRITQGKLTFFGQHHDADCGDRLRHGHDLENRVLAHGPAGLNIRHAQSVKLNDIVAMGHKRHRACDCMFVNKMLRPLRDLRENLLVYTTGVSRMVRCEQDRSTYCEKNEKRNCPSHSYSAYRT